MPILGLEPTHFISEGYWQHAFKYLVCRKKYADIGTQNNSSFPKANGNMRSTTWAVERNMPVLGFEPHSLLPKDTGNPRSTTRDAERIMPILGLEPTQFISEGYCQHAFNYLRCRKKYANIGARTNTVYFRRQLPTRFQLPGLQKDKCRYWDSYKNSLFPKANGKTRSTTWAAERNMPVL